MPSIGFHRPKSFESRRRALSVAVPFGPTHKVRIRSKNIGLQTMCTLACGTTLNGAVPDCCSLGGRLVGLIPHIQLAWTSAPTSSCHFLMAFRTTARNRGSQERNRKPPGRYSGGPCPWMRLFGKPLATSRLPLIVPSGSCCRFSLSNDGGFGDRNEDNQV